MKLTAKRQRFVEVYAGNATEAARLAGYSGSPATLSQTGYELLRIPEVAAAIKARQETAARPLIASREQRQAFWTKVQADEGADMQHRLKASELLGRSEADFVDRQEHSGAVSVSIAINRAVRK